MPTITLHNSFQKKKKVKTKSLLKNEIFKWHHCLETEFANKYFDGKGLIAICRVYYTKKVSYVFMVPSTNQPGFFFLKNSIVFQIKLSTQKNYGEKNEVEKRKRKKKFIVVPTPGIEPGPRRWERRILTTRPYGIDDCFSGIFRILTTLPRD